ncbi:MAG: hypothetical protein A3K03_06795 [Bdellovibrionales bacterium RIFOXYD1_FULL_44_7]|nr:MAG: hypothetical protein A3K03_06795 [Bdellovibrionales bacterium RIFOXYD1_FULL_44_7]
MVMNSFFFCIVFVFWSSFSAVSVFAFGARSSESGMAENIIAEEYVWISKSDGALSCGEREGQTLEEGVRGLAKENIEALELRKINDGKMRIQMCGALVGSENSYKIKKSDRTRAIALGYKELAKKTNK